MLIIKKTIQKLTLGSLLIVIAIFSVNLLISYVTADDVGTSVTIGNTVPTLGTVVESTASTQAAPTNYGLGVTFQGTGTDANGDQYYLIVCDEAGATAGDDAVPTCTGTAWCTSALTDSASQAECTYSTASATESNAWFAYACDKLASASSPGCSSVDQGTGDSGSPFEINHAPDFTVAGVDDNTPDPNTQVTFTTTASDGDSSGAQDTVSLYVCSTAAFTGGASPACTVDTLCSHLAQTSGPTCNYTSLRPDGAYGAYTYIVDSHGMVAAGVQAEDNSLTVNNVAPSITAGTITLKNTGGESTLALTTVNGETEDFIVEFIVTDDNSCDSNEISSALMHARLSSLAQDACDVDGEDDTDSCYANAQAGTGGECVQDTNVDTCTGTTDTTVGWKCTFPLNYNAEPTVTDSTYAADTWRVAIQATDNNSANSGLVDDEGSVEMGYFLGYSFTAGTPIVYGSVGANSDSSEQTVVLRGEGNVGMDMEVSGGNDSNQGLCTDWTDQSTACSGETLAIGQQVFNLTGAAGWGAGAALTYASSEKDLNVLKPIDSGLTPTKDTYYYLRIPDAQAAGTYTGVDVLMPVTGEFAAW